MKSVLMPACFRELGLFIKTLPVFIATCLWVGG